MTIWIYFGSIVFHDLLDAGRVPFSDSRRIDIYLDDFAQLHELRQTVYSDD